jgi:hypothetical protein
MRFRLSFNLGLLTCSTAGTPTPPRARRCHRGHADAHRGHADATAGTPTPPRARRHHHGHADATAGTPMLTADTPMPPRARRHHHGHHGSTNKKAHIRSVAQCGLDSGHKILSGDGR